MTIEDKDHPTFRPGFKEQVTLADPEILILERFAYLENCATGKLFMPGHSGPLMTLECPWRHNQPFVSCIPEGSYECRFVDSPRFGRSIQLEPVPGRTHILVHAGNTVSDTQGCILLGKNFMSHERIGHSRDAIEEFHGYLDGQVAGRRLVMFIKAARAVL